jgi:hypothetical protein
MWLHILSTKLLKGASPADTPPEPTVPVQMGGWVEYRKPPKKKKQQEPELVLLQTGHVVLPAVPSKEDVSTAIALVHHKKAKYNAVVQQRKDEEELLLMF